MLSKIYYPFILFGLLFTKSLLYAETNTRCERLDGQYKFAKSCSVTDYRPDIFVYAYDNGEQKGFRGMALNESLNIEQVGCEKLRITGEKLGSQVMEVPIHSWQNGEDGSLKAIVKINVISNPLERPFSFNRFTAEMTFEKAKENELEVSSKILSWPSRDFPFQTFKINSVCTLTQID